VGPGRLGAVLGWRSLAELGVGERFGLVHVDFQSLRRTPKDSFRWYREVIRTNGASLKGRAPR